MGGSTVHETNYSCLGGGVSSKGVRRILVSGVDAALTPENLKNGNDNNNNNNHHQLDQPVITRITSPPPPIPKTALFARFRFLIFHPFFQGVS